MLYVIAALLFCILLAVSPAARLALMGLGAIVLIGIGLAAAAIAYFYLSAHPDLASALGGVWLIVLALFLLARALNAGMHLPGYWKAAAQGFASRWRLMSRWDRAVVSFYGVLIGFIAVVIALPHH